LFLFLLFIFPLGIYCLILGVLNRRDRPLLVSGPWDFAGVLFAASGFLLFVGPAVLSSLHERWRYYWMFGDTSTGEEMNSLAHYSWLAAWYLYYVIVVGGAAFLLRQRRCLTAIYNITFTDLEIAFARVFERLDIGWTRQGNHYLLKAATGYSAELELEPAATFHHATLHWHDVQPAIRQEIERELEKVLAGMPTPTNYAASWFLSLASLFIFITLLGVLLIILISFRIIR
jgi:hypothetical protein